MLAAPTTFDPATVEDGTTIDMLQQVFEGLVQWTPDNKVAPALAEKWAISPDGRTYTFHLRPGVKFQDGHPVTAQDVYFSLRRALDPGLNSSVTNYLEDIVGAKDVEKGAADLTGVKVDRPHDRRHYHRQAQGVLDLHADLPDRLRRLVRPRRSRTSA